MKKATLTSGNEEKERNLKTVDWEGRQILSIAPIGTCEFCWESIAPADKVNGEKGVVFHRKCYEEHKILSATGFYWENMCSLAGDICEIPKLPGRVGDARKSIKEIVKNILSKLPQVKKNLGNMIIYFCETVDAIVHCLGLEDEVPSLFSPMLIYS